MSELKPYSDEWFADQRAKTIHRQQTTMGYSHEKAVLMFLNHMLGEVGIDKECRFIDAHDAFKAFIHDIAPQYRSDEEMFEALLPKSSSQGW